MTARAEVLAALAVTALAIATGMAHLLGRPKWKDVHHSGATPY